MSRLAFISDEDLEAAVDSLLSEADHALEKAGTKFEKNVIDPFAAIFEMAGFNLDENMWRSNEKTRKAQKTLSNQIGKFHQSILGHVKGWVNLGTGEIVDLVSEEKRIIAEIKNKHNTVKGSNLADVYSVLESSVMHKHSKYRGFTGYYVEIIPKKPQRIDSPFVPSDSSLGKKKPENELIRKVDGYTFYKIVTGIDDALLQLFNALPEVIESRNGITKYKFHDVQFLNDFFKSAFGM